MDAPVVLGWPAWREIDAQNGLGSLKEELSACVAAGHIAEGDMDPLAVLISGALNEAVFAIAHASEETLSGKHFDIWIERMVRGLLSDHNQHNA